MNARVQSLLLRQLVLQYAATRAKDMNAFSSYTHRHAPGSSSTHLTWLLVFQPDATCIKLYRISNSSSTAALMVPFVAQLQHDMLPPSNTVLTGHVISKLLRHTMQNFIPILHGLPCCQYNPIATLPNMVLGKRQQACDSAASEGVGEQQCMHISSSTGSLQQHAAIASCVCRAGIYVTPAK